MHSTYSSNPQTKNANIDEETFINSPLPTPPVPFSLLFLFIFTLKSGRKIEIRSSEGRKMELRHQNKNPDAKFLKDFKMQCKTKRKNLSIILLSMAAAFQTPGICADLKKTTRTKQNSSMKN